MADPAALVARGVTLVPAPGAGAPLVDLELRIDRSGVTQLGGNPTSAWQIPWGAVRDVRVGRRDAVVLVALSFGALRYRWEVPVDGVEGGPDALLDALRAYAGARPMLRGMGPFRRRP